MTARQHVVLTVSLLLGHAVEGVRAQQDTRFAAASFVVPDGWAMQGVEGHAVVRTAAGDETVRIDMSRPLTGTVEVLGAELIDAAAKLPDHRLEVPSEAGRHSRLFVRRSGSVWAALRVVWPMLDAAGKQQLVAGRRRQALLDARQRHYRMMQNVMQMQHDTMRIMAGNTSHLCRW